MLLPQKENDFFTIRIIYSCSFFWFFIDKALHLIVLCQLMKLMHKMLSYIEDLTRMLTCWADPEGEDRGSGPPLKNHKAIGFLSNTCPDPLKLQSYQASIQ